MNDHIHPELTPKEKTSIVLGKPHPNDFGIPKEYWERAQYYAEYWYVVKRESNDDELRQENEKLQRKVNSLIAALKEVI